MSWRSLRVIFFIWLAWVFSVIGFQAWALMRLQPKSPDYALEWTPNETYAGFKDDKPYLREPFMNQQVAWDSEFYLSIAIHGYSDPDVSQADINGEEVPLNFAFLPFYPFLMRLLIFPLKIIGLSPIATATLAGVIVSALGTLAGMIALYELAREELEEAGGIRAVFYLLIFPAGFFLVQVYTEGLFIGLAFGSLALLKRKKMLWAVLLAVFATLTRAVGVALVIPLVYNFIRSRDWNHLDLGDGLKTLTMGLLTIAPLAAYFVWRTSTWGQMFQLVEDNYFGRQFLAIGESIWAWSQAFISMFGENRPMAAYYMVEIAAILLGYVACLFTIRRYPEITMFSLAAITISLISGEAQGMHRYVMTAPSVFLFLSWLGKSETFDRAWTVASTLVMGVMALLFAADMWAG